MCGSSKYVNFDAALAVAKTALDNAHKAEETFKVHIAENGEQARETAGGNPDILAYIDAYEAAGLASIKAQILSSELLVNRIEFGLPSYDLMDALAAMGEAQDHAERLRPAFEAAQRDKFMASILGDLPTEELVPQ